MKLRANIHLDDDVYRFAAAYASAKSLPLGAAVSELLRQRAAQSPESSTRLKTNSLGLLIKRKTGKIITPAMVRDASEQDLD